MQENHYQFFFPIGKIGNVSGHSVCNTHKIAARQTLGPTYSGKTLSSILTTVLPVVDTQHTGTLLASPVPEATHYPVTSGAVTGHLH